MNLTISVDDELLASARALANRRGVSLQELLREHLRTLVGERSGTDVAAELLELMSSHGGHSGGRRWRQEDTYQGRSWCAASSTPTPWSTQTISTRLERRARGGPLLR